MKKELYEEFNKLRRQTAKAIGKILSIDGHCKSYEGTWELSAIYPDYFEDETASSEPHLYRITLHCYLLGPGCHYGWQGNSWEEALRKCKTDIEDWTENWIVD